MNSKLALNCLVEMFKELDYFEKKVISLVTTNTNNTQEFISSITDVADYGCGSGCASAFIYTSDNKAFFKENLYNLRNFRRYWICRMDETWWSTQCRLYGMGLCRRCL